MIKFYLKLNMNKYHPLLRIRDKLQIIGMQN